MSFEVQQINQLVSKLSSSSYSLSKSQKDSDHSSQSKLKSYVDTLVNDSESLTQKHDSFNLSESYQLAEVGESHNTENKADLVQNINIDHFINEQIEEHTRSNEEFIQYTLQNFEQIKRTMQTSELDHSSVILAINNIKSQIKSLRLERMSDMTEKQAQTRVRYLEVENQRQMKKVDFWTRVLQGQISRQ